MISLSDWASGPVVGPVHSVTGAVTVSMYFRASSRKASSCATAGPVWTEKMAAEARSPAVKRDSLDTISSRCCFSWFVCVARPPSSGRGLRRLLRCRPLPCLRNPAPSLGKGCEADGEHQRGAVEDRFDEEGAAELLDARDADGEDQDADD